MALVICRVLVTLRMRRRMSRMLGMNQSFRLLAVRRLVKLSIPKAARIPDIDLQRPVSKFVVRGCQSWYWVLGTTWPLPADPLRMFPYSARQHGQRLNGRLGGSLSGKTGSPTHP